MDSTSIDFLSKKIVLNISQVVNNRGWMNENRDNFLRVFCTKLKKIDTLLQG
jgi:hypothetical protein